MKHKIIIFIFSITSIFFITSCVKYDFQEPEVAGCDLDFEPNISLEDFIDLYVGIDKEPFLIDTNVVIKGTVIANDKSGNIYKSFYIQDSTAAGAQTALLVSINEYETHNKYRVGDMIYIKCQGLYLGYYGDVIQLGGLFEGEIGRIEEPLVDLHIFNACNGKPIVPKLVTIDQLSAVPVNTLIKLENVQFKLGELDETYADALQNITSEQYITDCINQTAMVRTSGFATFAGDPIPQGNGSIIAINGAYNGTPQLTIRDVNEVLMNDPRCGPLFEETFEFNLGSFNSYSVIGDNQYWVYSSQYGAVMSGNVSSVDYANEDWLISDAIDLSGYSNLIFKFRHALNYITSLNDVEVYICNDYDGSSNPNTSGSWTKLTGIIYPPGTNWSWLGSGDIDISAYGGDSSVFIAFKYTSSAAGASTWELDEIYILEN